MMLQAGVIGVGAMGRHHARVYGELDETELVAVADTDRARLDAVERCYRVRTYVDYREMLIRERLDLVSVVVPTQWHRAVALDVIEAGIHLLVEKPIAATVEDAQDIIKAAARRGVKLTVGHVERFNPAVIELKRRLGRGELGRVFAIHARRVGPFPARVRDVGVVIDLATHELDIMPWLIGQPVQRVRAETARHVHASYEDSLSAVLRFADGTIGTLDVNWLTPTKVRELSVTGERGMFVANYLTQELYFYENGHADGQWETLAVLTGVAEGDSVRLRIEHREPLQAELASFIEMIRTHNEPLVTGADGLAAVALAQALIEAGRTGEPSTL
jgi:UDP-N-acetylglucosamine 3-dehydrogenase